MQILIRIVGNTNTLLVAVDQDVVLHHSYPSRRALLAALSTLEPAEG